MKAIWIFSILLMAACSANDVSPDECIDPTRKNPDRVCTAEFRPVCGCDGVTYGNACEASHAGVKSYTEGACDCIDESKISSGPCTLEYAPVCGCNGETYPTKCVAMRAGVTSWTEGECNKK